MGDTDGLTLATCPYCGHADPNSWEFENDGDYCCASCGKAFYLTTETVRYYTTRPYPSPAATPEREERRPRAEGTGGP